MGIGDQLNPFVEDDGTSEGLGRFASPSTLVNPWIPGLKAIGDWSTSGMPKPGMVPLDPRFQYQMNQTIKESRETPEQYSLRLTEGTNAAAAIPGGMVSGQAMPINAAMQNMLKERTQSQATSRQVKSVWEAGKIQDGLRQQAFNMQKTAHNVNVSNYERWLKAEQIHSEARANVIKGIIGAGAMIGGAAIGGPAGAQAGSSVAPKQTHSQVYEPDAFSDSPEANDVSSDPTRLEAQNGYGRQPKSQVKVKGYA